MPNYDPIKDKLRAWPMLVIGLVLMFLATTHSEISLATVTYGFSRMAMGGYLGYWFDRWAFPYGRPHKLQGEAKTRAMQRRVWIIFAFVIGAALIA